MFPFEKLLKDLEKIEKNLEDLEKLEKAVPNMSQESDYQHAVRRATQIVISKGERLWKDHKEAEAVQLWEEHYDSKRPRSPEMLRIATHLMQAYLYGLGVKPDITKSLTYMCPFHAFDTGKDSNCDCTALMLFELGTLYEEGKVEPDSLKSKRAFWKAEEVLDGHDVDLVPDRDWIWDLMGRHIYKKIESGRYPDFQKAYESLQDLRHMPPAAAWLKKLDDAEEPWKRFVRWADGEVDKFRQKAKHEPRAMFWLGEHYEGNQALYWYRRAAQHGHPEAQKKVEELEAAQYKPWMDFLSETSYPDAPEEEGEHIEEGC